MRLEINVNDDRKIVEIWLSHSEQADAALREQLRPIYQEYNGKKYRGSLSVRHGRSV